MAWAPFLLALTAAVTSCAGTKEAMDKRGIEIIHALQRMHPDDPDGHHANYSDECQERAPA